MADKNTAEKRIEQESATIVDISGGKKEVVSKKKKKERKKGGLRKFIFTLILLLLIAGFAVVVFVFNFMDMRTAFFGFVHNLDPDYRAISDQWLELYAEERNLESLQIALAAEEARLKALEKDLNEKEVYLSNTEASRVPIYRPPVNEDDVIYMQSLSKIFAAMDAKSAAGILVKLYKVEDMAAIIYYMAQANAAAIMENMDAETAASITNQLLHE